VAERIDDVRDPRLGDYVHAGDPRWLRDHGLFLAEGRLVVERLILGRRFAVRSILVTPPARDALAGVLATVRCPVYVVLPAVMESLTGFDFHRGCLAIGERASAPILDRVAPGSRRLLCMEGVANPDNVGGLFRVVEAFGGDCVLLDPASGDPLYRKAIRTSVGAVMRLPFHRLEPWPAALRILREDGFTVVALTPREPSIPLSDYASGVATAERLIVLAGAEGSGLSDAVLQIAHARVRIPLDAGVDSLNVVVAAAIALAALWPVSSASTS
jgi:tRNA G18 (ribose-2'-O)-methylase SpoU